MAAVSDLLIYFFLFSFCGWLCESVFCSIKDKTIVNRGFVNGPLCPVYGFGGLIVVYLLTPFQNNLLLLFLTGMVATTALEYVTSFVLEKLFHTSWWDYSDLPLNLNGRVCLQFAVIFGALSVVAQRLLAPPFMAMVASVPAGAKRWIALGMLVVFLLDVSVTVNSILRLNGKLAELKNKNAELKAKLEAFQTGSGSLALVQRLERFRADNSERAQGIRESVEQAAHRIEQLRGSRQGFVHRRLFRAFPHMKSTKYGEQLSQIKAAFHAWAEKREKK